MDCNTIRQKLADITLPDFKPLLLNYTQDPLADCAPQGPRPPRRAAGIT